MGHFRPNFSPKLENLNLRILNVNLQNCKHKTVPASPQLIPVASQVASLLHLITETQAKFASTIYSISSLQHKLTHSSKNSLAKNA